MKTNRRREYLIWCSMGVIMPAVILAMCFRYTDVMTSVGLIAERVFPGLFGMLILLIAVLLVLKCLRDFHDQKDVTANDGDLPRRDSDVGSSPLLGGTPIAVHGIVGNMNGGTR